MPSRPSLQGLLEDRSAIVTRCALSTMPSRRLPSSLASRFLRSPSGRPRRSSPSPLQEVERVQHGLADRAAAVQSVEDRDTVRTADRGLAIERE
jgi:hypothetical protein